MPADLSEALICAWSWPSVRWSRGRAERFKSFLGRFGTGRVGPIPNSEVVSLLRQVEARGVDVRLRTNAFASSNHIPAYAAYQNHVDVLLRLGAEIYEMRADARSRERYVQPPPGPEKLVLRA